MEAEIDLGNFDYLRKLYLTITSTYQSTQSNNIHHVDLYLGRLSLLQAEQNFRSV